MNFLKGNYKIKKKFKTKKLSKEEELEKIFEENAKKELEVVWFMSPKKS